MACNYMTLGLGECNKCPYCSLPCCVTAADLQEIILCYSLLILIVSRRADVISDVCLSDVGFVSAIIIG